MIPASSSASPARRLATPEEQARIRGATAAAAAAATTQDGVVRPSSQHVQQQQQQEQHRSKKQLRLRRLFKDSNNNSGTHHHKSGDHQHPQHADPQQQQQSRPFLDSNLPENTRASRIPKEMTTATTANSGEDEFADFSQTNMTTTNATATSFVSSPPRGRANGGATMMAVSTTTATASPRLISHSTSSNSSTTTNSNIIANSMSSRTTPPRLLQPSARDSRKKPRAFAVPLRKQSDRDPPTTTTTQPQQQQQQQQYSPASGSSRSSSNTTNNDAKDDAANEQDQDSAYGDGDGDDDSTAVHDHRSSSVVQHLSPLSSSLVPPSYDPQQHPQQLAQQPFAAATSSSALRKPAAQRFPPTSSALKQQSQQQKQQQQQPPTRGGASLLQQQPERSSIHSKSGSHNKSQPSKSSSRSSKKQQHHPSPQLLKAALARPFGRPPPNSTSSHHGNCWVVEVSSAEWDADERRWKYRILVQKRVAAATAAANKTSTSTSLPPRSSFTTAFTWRSVADFFWLEQALQREFQGALLLPLLSVALGAAAGQIMGNHTTSTTSISSVASEMPVESERLKHWLSDVLNGVRGCGEWQLPVQQQQQQQQQQQLLAFPQVDVIQCESVETFLYRNPNGGTLGEAVQAASKQRTTRADASTPTPAAFQCGGVAADRVRRSLRCNDAPIGGDGGGGPKKSGRTGSSGGGGEDAMDGPPSMLQALMDTVAMPLDLCVGPAPMTPHSASSSQRHRGNGNGSGKGSPQRKSKKHHHHQKQPHFKAPNYSSRALGTAADLSIEDSFVETSSAASLVGSLQESGGGVIHFELLNAEKDLALNYRKTALGALEKLHTLHDEEEKLAVAWRRFGVALSNLFCHEKDVEHATLGDMKVKKDQMPYRKIDKKAVEDSLRDMARQKAERSTPALVALSSMLHAYVADLSAVPPSVDLYSKAVSELVSSSSSAPSSSKSSDSGDIRSSSSGSTSSSASEKDPLRAAKNWEELKEWTVKSLKKANIRTTKARAAMTTRTGGDSVDANSLESEHSRHLALKRNEQQRRLMTNAKLLRISLTTMFRTTPFRVSRMAWRYWNTEASQCALLNSAAAALRSEVDAVVSKSLVSKMLMRHTKEEKADCACELDLIQRIVNLGKWKKFTSSADSQTDGSVSLSTIDNETIEVDNEEMNEDRSMAMLRDAALDVARQRIGRWDAAVATAIMKAVGVSDPNVRVEETTKDLRLVRKYAIGLRENVDRCVEAVRMLHHVVAATAESQQQQQHSAKALSIPSSMETGPSPPPTKSQLSSRRAEFLDELCLLLSGTVVGKEAKEPRSLASRAVLTNAGIDTSDPFGWIPAATAAATKNRRATLLTQGRVGDLALRYISVRDTQVEWLLDSLNGLLNEYYQRVEAIESYVYMECLGIQLEKHFSAKRAGALSSFEKKTDLTAAINVATRKRMQKLEAELQKKLDQLGPDVSHTTVKETKEAHLDSKNLKSDLHDLAVRRLMRARESSTERVTTIMSLWAKEEEVQATEELKALGEAMATLERLVCKEDFER